MKLLQVSRNLLLKIQKEMFIQLVIPQDILLALEKRGRVLNLARERLVKTDCQLSSLTGRPRDCVSSVVRSGAQDTNVKMFLCMLWKRCVSSCLIINLSLGSLMKKKMIQGRI